MSAIKRKSQKAESAEVITMSKDRYRNKPMTHKPPPEGTHKAVLVQFIELGMQPGYNGGNDEDTVYLTFELPNTFRDDGNPFLVGRHYTIKYGAKANWTKVLKALLGRTPEIDEVIGPDDLIGEGCQLSIVHEKRDDGSVVGKIESLMALSHGDVAPKYDSNLLFYDFMKPQKAVLDQLPDFLKDAINKGNPYPEPELETTADFDDDIPM